MAVVKQERAIERPGAKPPPALLGRRKAKSGRDLEPLVGRKHLRAITEYLVDLRALYPHPNRILFYDDVVMAYLVAFFNPSIRSLRCMEDMSQVPGIQRFLSVDALCKSTFSEANQLFDPDHLLGLLNHVRQNLPEQRVNSRADPDFQEILQRIICLDGTFFRIAADVQWALWHRHQKADTQRHIRVNTMYCLATGLPEGISISGDDGTSEGTEAMALLKAKEAPDASGEPVDAIYLFDSGVVSFALLKTIQQRGESFLCNLASKVRFTPSEPLELTPADQEAGVISDTLGTFPGSTGHEPPQGVLREIVVPYTDRHDQPRRVRLVTNLLALPAHRIAELYRYRWQIEVFFRWLKVHARFRHLMSFSRKGVTTGFYIAVLAAMLLCINSGEALDKYTLNLFGAVANGLATPAQVLPIIARRARAKRLERERVAQLKGSKNVK